MGCLYTYKTHKTKWVVYIRIKHPKRKRYVSIRINHPKRKCWYIPVENTTFIFDVTPKTKSQVPRCISKNPHVHFVCFLLMHTERRWSTRGGFGSVPASTRGRDLLGTEYSNSEVSESSDEESESIVACKDVQRSYCCVLCERRRVCSVFILYVFYAYMYAHLQLVCSTRRRTHLCCILKHRKK